MRSPVLDAVRDQVAEALDDGATLEEVEDLVLRTAPISHEARDALWLYAWTLQEGQGQRPMPR